MNPARAALFLSLLAACGKGAGAATDGGAPRPSGSAEAGLACRPAAGRCASDDDAWTCKADGSGWDAQRCEAGTLCVAGRCASLRDPSAGGEALDCKRLLAIRGEGWLNAWAVSAPLAIKQVQRFQEAPTDITSGGTNTSWKELCAPDGFVSVLGKPDQRQKPPAYAILAGYLVSSEKRSVLLESGAVGGFRVWLGAAQVLDVTRPGGVVPLRDDIVTRVDLEPGVNRIAVVLEQVDENPPGFWMRVRDPSNQPIDGLLFAPAVASAKCAPSDLLDLDLRPQPVAGGFSITTSPRLRGLAPREPVDVPLRAELKSEGGKLVRELVSAHLPSAELSRGTGKLALPVTPPKAGNYDLTVSIGDPPAEPRKLRVAYAGELHERIVKLVGGFGSIGTSLPPGSRESYEGHLQRLTRALADNESDLGWLAEQVADAEKIGSTLGAGLDAYRGRTGVVQRAYRSRLDGELQPYVVAVPRSYRPDAKPVPLIVVFHGQNRLPEHGLRTLIGEAPDDHMSLGFAARHIPAIADQHAILAAPWGYGNSGPRALGEDDVMRVIEEIQGAYNVDRLRVSITGYSLGGTVAFVVPLHYPDVFSASAPLCGYPNLTGYDSIRNVPHTPWEDALIAKRYIVNYAENGLHLPLNIVHGGLDGPGRSAVMADRYQSLGYSRIFDIQDELDHNVWDYAYEKGKMIEWLKAKKRPERPDHVCFVTGEYRYDCSYWVRLVAMRELQQLADIDATWNKADGKLEVGTSNVATFAIDAAALEIAEGARAVVDGTEIPIPAGTKTVFFDRSGGAWKRIDAEPSRAGRKRPGVSGPLDDVLRHRVLVVYGTQDPAQTEADRMVADHFATYDPFQWSLRDAPPAGARYPVKADVEVADADLTGRSLILVGGPQANKITAALAAGLPVQFDANAIVMRGKRYEGDEVGVSLIAPHPRDDKEYVVLHAGTRFRGTLASRNLPQFAPDYLVYDGRITVQRGDLLLDKRAVLDGGFFGDDWK